jgi:hypothetical protein
VLGSGHGTRACHRIDLRTGTRIAHTHYQVALDRIVPLEPPPGVAVRVTDARLTRATEAVRTRLGIGDGEVGTIERVCTDVVDPLWRGIGYCRPEHLDALAATTYLTFEQCFGRVFGVPLGSVERPS